MKNRFMLRCILLALFAVLCCALACGATAEEDFSEYLIMGPVTWWTGEVPDGEAHQNLLQELYYHVGVWENTDGTGNTITIENNSMTGLDYTLTATAPTFGQIEFDNVTVNPDARYVIFYGGEGMYEAHVYLPHNQAPYVQFFSSDYYITLDLGTNVHSYRWKGALPGAAERDPLEAWEGEWYDYNNGATLDIMHSHGDPMLHVFLHVDQTFERDFHFEADDYELIHYDTPEGLHLSMFLDAYSGGRLEFRLEEDIDNPDSPDPQSYSIGADLDVLMTTFYFTTEYPPDLTLYGWSPDFGPESENMPIPDPEPGALELGPPEGETPNAGTPVSDGKPIDGPYTSWDGQRPTDRASDELLAELGNHTGTFEGPDGGYASIIEIDYGASIYALEAYITPVGTVRFDYLTTSADRKHYIFYTADGAYEAHVYITGDFGPYIQYYAKDQNTQQQIGTGIYRYYNGRGRAAGYYTDWAEMWVSEWAKEDGSSTASLTRNPDGTLHMHLHFEPALDIDDDMPVSDPNVIEHEKDGLKYSLWLDEFDIIELQFYPWATGIDQNSVYYSYLFHLDGNEIYPNTILYKPVSSLAPRDPGTPGQTEAGTVIDTEDSVFFGHYEQDDNQANGQEPILWDILGINRQENRVTLISHYILDAKPYNSYETDMTWENSELRAWLNGYFLNKAFSASEQDAILLYPTANKIGSDSYSVVFKKPYDTDPGNDTEDKVCVLSFYEISFHYVMGVGAQTVPTKYAKANGAYVDQNYLVNGEPAGAWWTRTPGKTQSQVILMNHNSKAQSSKMTYPGVGVRPVIHVDLNKVGWVPAPAKETATPTPTPAPTPTPTAAPAATDTTAPTATVTKGLASPETPQPVSRKLYIAGDEVGIYEAFRIKTLLSTLDWEISSGNGKMNGKLKFLGGTGAFEGDYNYEDDYGNIQTVSFTGKVGKIYTSDDKLYRMVLENESVKNNPGHRIGEDGKETVFLDTLFPKRYELIFSLPGADPNDLSEWVTDMIHDVKGSIAKPSDYYMLYNSITGVGYYAREVNGWNRDLFLHKATQYNKEMALVCADLSQEAEDTKQDKIEKQFKKYGIESGVYKNYNIEVPGAWFLDDIKNMIEANEAFAIGKNTFSIEEKDDTTVLVIVGRGTQMRFKEIEGDLLKNGTTPLLGKNVYKNIADYEEQMWNGLEKYIGVHPIWTPKVKILITGHSLGGAAANLLGARITHNLENISWLKDKEITKDDIYVYTFGAIKVIDEDISVSKGYENIHNIYNKHDTFGPGGSLKLSFVSSERAKFGHTDLFDIDAEDGLKNGLFACHEMFTYKKAINENMIKCWEGSGTLQEPESGSRTGSVSPDDLFINLSGIKMQSSSGAGAWEGTLQISSSGYFTGEYSDADDERVEMVSFSGTFGDVTRVTNTTYLVTVTSANTERASGTEEEGEYGEHIVYTDTILPVNSKWLLTLPGTPETYIPEMVKGLIDGTYAQEKDHTAFYTLTDLNNGWGFFAEGKKKSDSSPDLATDSNPLNRSLFKQKASAYNNDLALVAAHLSEEIETYGHDGIEKQFEAYRIRIPFYGQYDIWKKTYVEWKGVFADGAFAIGQKILSIKEPEDTTLLVVVGRGTVNPQEAISDAIRITGTHSFLNRKVDIDIMRFEYAMWDAVNEYLSNHTITTPKVKVLVTGHSLGGAMANLFGAQMTNFYSYLPQLEGKMKKEDVYVYTFGAIKVLESSTNAAYGFNNIHNIYYKYDSFGPDGNWKKWGVSSPNYKFGHTEYFEDKTTKKELFKDEWGTSTNNHNMPLYIEALENGYVHCHITVSNTNAPYLTSQAVSVRNVTNYGKKWIQKWLLNGDQNTTVNISRNSDGTIHVEIHIYLIVDIEFDVPSADEDTIWFTDSSGQYSGYLVLTESGALYLNMDEDSPAMADTNVREYFRENSMFFAPEKEAEQEAEIAEAKHIYDFTAPETEGIDIIVDTYIHIIFRNRGMSNLTAEDGETWPYYRFTVTNPQDADIIFHLGSSDGEGGWGSVDGNLLRDLVIYATDGMIIGDSLVIPAGSSVEIILRPIGGGYGYRTAEELINVIFRFHLTFADESKAEEIIGDYSIPLDSGENIVRQPADAYTRYDAGPFGFEYEIPEDWQVANTYDMIRILPPPALAETMEEYITIMYAWDGLKGELDAAEDYTREDGVFIGGYPLTVWRGTATIIVVFRLENGSEVVLDIRWDEKFTDLVKPIIDDFLASIHFVAAVEPVEPAKELPAEPVPEITEEPMTEPTEVLTPKPTDEPTPEPTEIPTPEPTETPTPEPTEAPTPEPTEVPTPEPTEVSTPEPTEVPTSEPEPETEYAPDYYSGTEPEPIEGKPGYLKVPVSGISATSYIVNKNNPDEYIPEKMIDGKDETCWQFSLSETKLGDAYIYVTFPSPMRVDELWMKNGFWKITDGYDQYVRNCRLRKIQVDFQYEGSEKYKKGFSISLKDDKKREDWKVIHTRNSKEITGMRIRVLAIYRGEKFKQDVAVSELMFVQYEK